MPDNDNSSKLKLQEFEQDKLRQLLVGNWNLNGRRIVGAGNSINQQDYVTRNEINTLISATSGLNSDGVKWVHLFGLSSDSLDARIRMAIADLPSSGGIVIASGLPGDSTWLANPFQRPFIPITFIANSGTSSFNFDITVPDNYDIIMPKGAIFNVADGHTLMMNLNEGSSLSQHFGTSGTVFLLRNYIIHTRWFDSGDHSHVAIQRAIDSSGDTTTTPNNASFKSGQLVKVDDVLTFVNTVKIHRKNLIIDCGGITQFNPEFGDNYPAIGGFIWNGVTDVPMMELTACAALKIQNSRFYGKVGAPPRSAISLVNKAPSGQGQIAFDNVYIGGMFGDDNYDAVNSFLNGIWIGDAFDSGNNGVNDHTQIMNCTIFGCSDTAIRQGSQQNAMTFIRNTQTWACNYGLRAVSEMLVENSIFSFCQSAVLYVPVLDDFGLQVGARLEFHKVESELSNRYMFLEGGAIIYVTAGSFQLTDNLNADAQVIKANTTNNTHTITLTGWSAGENRTIHSTWYISMKPIPGGGASKVLNFLSGPLASVSTLFPNLVIDMDSANKNDVHIFSQQSNFVDTLAWQTDAEQWLTSYNVLRGYPLLDHSDFGAVDQSVYHIPAKKFRTGDVQNGAGAFEIQTTTFHVSFTSGTSITLTGAFPANCIVYGLSGRDIGNITLSAGGTIRVGSGSDATKWSSNFGLNNADKLTILNWAASAVSTVPYVIQAAEDVVISTSGPSFVSGDGVFTTYWAQLLAPPTKF